MAVGPERSRRTGAIRLGFASGETGGTMFERFLMKMGIKISKLEKSSMNGLSVKISLPV